MDQNTAWQKVLLVLVLSTLLVGCWGTPTRQAPSTPDLLLQSGFQAQPAKSPHHLQNLPGYQFVTVQRQGRTIYVYTEPRSKQLYFGSEAAYYRYKARAARAWAAEAQQAPPSAQPSMSAFDWEMYGDLHGVSP